MNILTKYYNILSTLKKILIFPLLIHLKFYLVHMVISTTPMSSTTTYTSMAVKSVSPGQIPPHPCFGLLFQILLAGPMWICHRQLNFSKSQTEYTLFLQICFTFSLRISYFNQPYIKAMPHDI